MLRHYTIISGVNFFYFGLASTAQKMKFFIKDSVTFTEEIPNFLENLENFIFCAVKGKKVI